MNSLSSTNPLLVDNYACVDERLREQYYRHLFIYDECQESGIFKKKFPFNLEWKNTLDSDTDTLECLDDDLDIYYRRTRSENDISEYKEQVGKAILRLNFQTEKNLDIPHVSELHECYPSPVPDYDADIDSSDFESLYLGSDDFESIDFGSDFESVDLGSDDLESVDLGSDCN